MLVSFPQIVELYRCLKSRGGRVSCWGKVVSRGIFAEIVLIATGRGKLYFSEQVG